MLTGLDIEATKRRLKAIVKYNETRDFYDLDDSVEFNHHLHASNGAPSRKKNAPKHIRMIIYPKDIEVIYGMHYDLCRHLLNNIRNYKELPNGAPVLITDFCEYTGFRYTVALHFTNDYQISEASWTKYYDSRDWYDMPEIIDRNMLLYKNSERIRHRWNKERNGRWIIYPKDIEVIYDYSPETASEFIQSIRKLLNLSISCPVMNYDLMHFTKTGSDLLHDFIMKS